MRFIWIFCVTFGCLLALYALNYETTVVSAGGVRVNNIGLIAERQNLMMLAVCAIVVGTMIALRSKPSKGGNTAEHVTSQGGTHPVMESFYEGERDLSSGPYKLYLVTKFGISKNETLGQFVSCGELFNSLEEALIFFDEKDKYSESCMKERQSNLVGTIGSKNLHFTVNQDGSVVVRVGGAFSRTYQTLDAAIESEGPVNK